MLLAGRFRFFIKILAESMQKSTQLIIERMELASTLRYSDKGGNKRAGRLPVVVSQQPILVVIS
jgi:hypothetical protein